MKLTAQDFRAVAKDAIEAARLNLVMGAQGDGAALNHIERAVAAMAEVYACRDRDVAESKARLERDQ